ncbi:unannotated protein [freshwater metagenome]|uniref:Unannotated protein n=1 Tax=freshwater metagenome TaxID=449393 RepID=A0A6J7SLY2_9ZZZZ
MGMQHALGPARRARCVDQIRRIVSCGIRDIVHGLSANELGEQLRSDREHLRRRDEVAREVMSENYGDSPRVLEQEPGFCGGQL